MRARKTICYRLAIQAMAAAVGFNVLRAVDAWRDFILWKRVGDKDKQAKKKSSRAVPNKMHRA